VEPTASLAGADRAADRGAHRTSPTAAALGSASTVVAAPHRPLDDLRGAAPARPGPPAELPGAPAGRASVRARGPRRSDPRRHQEARPVASRRWQALPTM